MPLSVDPVGGMGSSGPSSSASTTGVSSDTGNLPGETLGLRKQDREKLLEMADLFAEVKGLYQYARDANRTEHEKTDVLMNFALGNQFLTYGDELNHTTSRPKRNATWDAIRHKTGLVTEPPANVEAFPRDPANMDPGGDQEQAQVVKAFLEYENDRLNTDEILDEVTLWAAMAGDGWVYQGYDPITKDIVMRVVPRTEVDPDPDHAKPSEWLYFFETIRLPIEEIRRRWPATGPFVEEDQGEVGETNRSPWSPSSSGSSFVATHRGSGQAVSGETSDGPKFATVALGWSIGHFKEEDSDEAEAVEMVCETCGSVYPEELPTPDLLGPASQVAPNCADCGIGPLIHRDKKGKKLVPEFERGKRLVAFAPYNDVVLSVGGWPTPEMPWPYTHMKWYDDPRTTWGKSETEFQWPLQILVNKLLVILSENAVANGTPKIILPDGIGFEDDEWNNIPSEKLVATDWRLIQHMRAFQGGDVPQSLVFLLPFVLQEQRHTGGFDDLSMGQIRGNTEISGRAIDRATAAAEVPVRHQLRRRYRFETTLNRNLLHLIRRHYTEEKAVRIVDPWGTTSVEMVLGSELPEFDVVVSSEPADAIDRAQRAEIGMKLLSTPDPVTGQPAIDAEGVAAWVGVPTRILRAARQRQEQRPGIAEQQTLPGIEGELEEALSGALPAGLAALPEGIVPQGVSFGGGL